MSWDIELKERKIKEEKLNDKTYEEIQEMINECLYVGDESNLADIARELLNDKYKKQNKSEVVVSEVGNYTYNVSKMYLKAMGKTMSDFHGMKASEAISLLEDGIYNMTNDPSEYEKLNPENGWGNYEGALEYLSKLLNACKENPNATIRVS